MTPWTWERVWPLLLAEQAVAKERVLHPKGIRQRQKRRKKKTANCPLRIWVVGGGGGD